MRLKSTSIKSTRLVLSTSQYYTIYDVTRSHLTLFPVFSRPFGLSSLQILYYIYKLNNKHYQCNIRSPVCHQGIVDWRLRWSGVLLWVEKWPSSLRLWPFTDQISVEVFSGNLQLAFERRSRILISGRDQDSQGTGVSSHLGIWGFKPLHPGPGCNVQGPNPSGGNPQAVSQYPGGTLQQLPSLQALNRFRRR